MSQYKVPQDVEADDKILGPFSFRQFVYLIVVAMAIALAWGLSKLYIFLAIIPTPIIIFFGALALPLRKDQPMETYLAAMVSFYLKPNRRIWDPDGIDSLIEITAPKLTDVQLTKDISQDEAQRRLSYLSEIVDTQGWAVRGVAVQPVNNAMNSDVYFEAQQTEDILDDNNTITKMFDNKLQQSNTDRHEAMAKIVSGQPIDYFNGQVTEPQVMPDQVSTTPTNIDYNPYPNIQQSVIQPLEDELAVKTPPVLEQIAVPQVLQQPITTPTIVEPVAIPAILQPEKPSIIAPPTTSDNKPTADIMNLRRLAVSTNLDVATIAREANRSIHKTQNDEVVISFRHDS